MSARERIEDWILTLDSETNGMQGKQYTNELQQIYDQYYVEYERMRDETSDVAEEEDDEAADILKQRVDDVFRPFHDLFMEIKANNEQRGGKRSRKNRNRKRKQTRRHRAYQL